MADIKLCPKCSTKMMTEIPVSTGILKHFCPKCEMKDAIKKQNMIGNDNRTYPIEGPGESGPEIKPHDPVNNPTHYTQGGIECIDALKAALTPEEFIGFLKGNTIKYLWRMNHKTSPSEDSAKAQWYLNKLNEELKNEVVK